MAIDKIKGIVSESSDVLKDVVDFLHETFDHYSWIGIYLVEGDDLVLAPWRGANATEHVRIPIGQGICGSAAATKKTEVIADVHSDERYLSCFVSTKSEIVIPIMKNGKVLGEIDIDSDRKSAFTKEDKEFLERVADMLNEHI